MSDLDEMAREIVGPCVCHAGYKDRGLIDPDCAWCDHGEEVAAAIRSERRAARNEALEEAAYLTLTHISDFVERNKLMNAIRALKSEEKSCNS